MQNSNMKNLMLITLLAIANVAFSQCLGGDCQNGYGKFKESDVLYTGIFVNGKKNGRGCNDYVNGNKYCGNFKDDKIEGKGEMTFADGASYAGDFKNGKPEGSGTYKYPDGAFYVGAFKNGNANGRGKLTISGDFQNGEFQNGELIKGFTKQTEAAQIKGLNKCITGNCESGFGEFEDSLGNQYKGNFVN